LVIYLFYDQQTELFYIVLDFLMESRQPFHFLSFKEDDSTTFLFKLLKLEAI